MTVLDQVAPGRLEQRSTRVAFFIAGFAMAVWAPLVPFAQARAGLSDGALGTLLLCFGIGSILALPAAGALAGRFGCRRVLVAASAVVCVALPPLGAFASPFLLAPALFVFGAGIGSIDCVINIQAVIVERASGRFMMSGFHGLFSFGGIVGAASMTGLLAIGLSPFLATLCVIVVVAAALAIAGPHLLSYGGKGDGPAFALPHGVVLLIGALCFIMFLTEGAVLDWGAVFLSSMRGMSPTFAGLGYAAFACTMTIGRLTGDGVVRRIGGGRMMLAGSLCAAFGLALATAAPFWPATILGYALVGAGCSNVVPILYTAVGRQTAMPEHVAVPAITTLGYAGILAGPAAIGFIAHASSLSAAFLMLALMLLAVAASSRRLKV